MAHAQLEGLLQYLRRLTAPSGHGGETDADLIARFLDVGEGAAFEALVRRHGPLVWRVCRSLSVMARQSWSWRRLRGTRTF